MTTSNSNQASNRSTAWFFSTTLGLLLLAVIAASLASQVWVAWHKESSYRLLDKVPAGTLVSVLLDNGQIYYGDLAASSHDHIQLANVVYVQQVPLANGQIDNRVVDRRVNDWHGPTWMSISTSKVVFIEGVGPNSRLAGLVTQLRQKAN